MNQEKYISYIPRSDLKQFSKKRVAVYSRVSRESPSLFLFLEGLLEEMDGYFFLSHLWGCFHVKRKKQSVLYSFNSF